MLEVHIGVQRFVVFLGNEALEQHTLVCWIDFGDAQTKTHRRIGCRTAALAKNVLGAGAALADVYFSEGVQMTICRGWLQVGFGRLGSRSRHLLHCSNRAYLTHLDDKLDRRDAEGTSLPVAVRIDR